MATIGGVDVGLGPIGSLGRSGGIALSGYIGPHWPNWQNPSELIFFLKKLISSKLFLMKNFFVQGKNFKHFETFFSEEIKLFGNPKPEIPGRNFVRKSFCSCRDLGQNDF